MIACSRTLLVTALICLLLPDASCSSQNVQEPILTLRGAPARQLQAAATVVYYVQDSNDLLEKVAVAQADPTQRTEFVLPADMTLSATLKLTMPTTLRGGIAGKRSLLRCGPSTATLIDFHGSELLLSGVQFQDCTGGPGITVAPSLSASITIVDSAFINFTRLVPGRVNLSAPDSPAPLSESSAALVLHARDFNGQLTIRNTTFANNAFLTPEPAASRRLTGASSTADGGQPAFRGGKGTVARSLDIKRTDSQPWAGMQSYPSDLANSAWQLPASSKPWPKWRRGLAGDATSSEYSLALLKIAKLIHPALQAGPWADDVEAVLSVLCGGSGAACNITLEGVSIVNNTGVATGGLYVLCDGATSCNVQLANCTVINNTLLWQPATEARNLPDASAGLAAVEYVFSDDGYSVVDGPLIVLLKRMVPWLTYTYPLIDYFSRMEIAPSTSLYDAAQYPSVTGRTLGAIVLHQRKSPATGLTPNAPAMMNVHVVGGVFANNDGSAIMSTATDFMEMAGGNGTWSGGPPRHSADISLSGVNVQDHSSGWPAIWLRWARNVVIDECKVTRSTGAVWLDEIRDSAFVKASAFLDNEMNQLWLDPIAFMVSAPLEGIPYESVGAGAAHLVKIQMTPLGGVANTANVVNCTFSGNPSYLSGVLYVQGSDSVLAYKNDLPGSTALSIVGTNFTSNKCRRNPTCLTGERPVYIQHVRAAKVQACRFTGNTNGGVYFDTVYGVTVTSSIFEDNILTYSIGEGQGDNSYGGAGVMAVNVGSGRVDITDTTFVNNTATVGGGAVYLRYADYITISDCRFDGNTAETFDGGALWMENSPNMNSFSSVLLTRCTFSGNRAGRNGGAVSAASIVPGTFWTMSSCHLENNTALLNPVDRGRRVEDRAGGGAIFASSAAIWLQDSVLSGNKVLGHAGGAIRIVDSEGLLLVNSTFENNVAIMGGAIAASRLTKQSTWESCTFINNTVVDPWAWPDTSPDLSLHSRTIPSLYFIDPGYGGAVYVYAAYIELRLHGHFKGNTAKFGGAIAIMSSSLFRITVDGAGADSSPISTVSVASEVAEAVGLPAAGALAVLPYRFLFEGNMALIGGALYISDVDTVSFSASLRQTVVFPGAPDQTLVEQGYQVLASFPDATLYLTPYSAKVLLHPGIVFARNLANGGGAVYLDGNGQVNLANCRFVENNASAPPLRGNFTGLHGREKDYASAKVKPCYNGGGGALCVVGLTNKTIQMASTDMVMNTAKDGGAIYAAEGIECVAEAGCYKLVLQSVNLTGNTAVARGGGIFWVHEGVLDIQSCSSDYTTTFATNGTALLDMAMPASATSAVTPYNISLTVPSRKGPALAYGQLAASNRYQLLSAWGGPVIATTRAVHVSRGQLVSSAKGVVFVTSAAASATIVDEDGGLLAADGSVLTATGLLTTAVDDREANESVIFQPAKGTAVISDASVVPDSAWLGIPHAYLPCADWNNSAHTGDDIASTPYFLLTPHRLDFYTSNTDIRLQVTVHDWYGQNCTGSSSAQPLVTVTANSTEVSGGLSVNALDGVAQFTTMRLRAQEGLHRVAMTGQLYSPLRDMLGDQVQIYVRPCAINEFISPKNLDECIPCDYGAFNFNVSAVACQVCPDDAECTYPDPAACKTDDTCDPQGFMVPHDGYWHSSFFSEQVHECPNQAACTVVNRSGILARIQLHVWQAARAIQVNISNAAADTAARDVLAKLVANLPSRRLLQAESLIADVDTLRILNASIDYMPPYLVSLCAPGYTGTLCGQCLPGYGWSRVATCVKCPRRILNNFYYALVTILTLSVLAFTVYSSLKEQQKGMGKLIAGPRKKPRFSNTYDNQAADGPPAGERQAYSATDMDGAAYVVGNVLESPNGGDRFFLVEHPIMSTGHHLASAPMSPRDESDHQKSLPSTFDMAARAHSLVLLPFNGPVSPNGLRFNSVSGGPKGGPLVPPGNPAGPLTKHSSAGPLGEGTEHANPLYTSSAGGPSGSNSSPKAIPTLGYPEVLPEGTEKAHANPLYAQGNGSGHIASRPFSPAEVEADLSDSTPVGEALEHANPLYVGGNGYAQPMPSPGRAPEIETIASHFSASGPMGAEAYPGFPAGAILEPVAMLQDGAHDVQNHPSAGQLLIQPSGAPPKKIRRPHQSTIVKIFLSYVQVLALLQNVPLEIPHMMDVYYRINNQAISYPGVLVSLDCSLPDGGVAKSMVRVILSVLAPLYLFVGAVIYLLIFDALDYHYIMPYREKHPPKNSKKRGPKRPDTFGEYMWEYLPRQLIVTFITIFFFFYPSVVQSLMTIFKCQEVDLPTENALAAGAGLQTDAVWSQDFGKACYKGSHMGLAMGLGVPGLLLIAIGWPVISALLVTQTLPGMARVRFTENMTQYFLADFKDGFVWWESIVMLRKLAIAVIVTFVDGSTSAGVQLLLVVCVIAIAMGVHLASMPYKHVQTNNLELASLATLLFTLYFSLYFSFSNSITDGGRVAISIIIVVINVIMVLTFIAFIVKAYWRAALKGAGLGDLNFEERRGLTKEQIRERVLQKRGALPRGSSAEDDTRLFDGLRNTGLVDGMTNVAFFGTRLASVSSRMLYRVRTLVAQDEQRDLLNSDVANPDELQLSVASNGQPGPERAAEPGSQPAPDRAASKKLGSPAADRASCPPSSRAAPDRRVMPFPAKQNSTPKLRTTDEAGADAAGPPPVRRASSSALEVDGVQMLPQPPLRASPSQRAEASLVAPPRPSPSVPEVLDKPSTARSPPNDLERQGTPPRSGTRPPPIEVPGAGSSFDAAVGPATSEAPGAGTPPMAAARPAPIEVPAAGAPPQAVARPAAIMMPAQSIPSYSSRPGAQTNTRQPSRLAVASMPSRRGQLMEPPAAGKGPAGGN